jgi:carbon-monoxide dehydrogenase small subunit
MSKHHVTTSINGEPVEFLCETQQTMLDTLRDVLGLTGSKEGCASGDCGACTIICDGRIVCSCLMLGVEAEGSRSATIGALRKGDHLHPVQQPEHAALCNAVSARRFIVAKPACWMITPTRRRPRRRWLRQQSLPLPGYDRSSAP